MVSSVLGKLTSCNDTRKALVCREEKRKRSVYLVSRLSQDGFEGRALISEAEKQEGKKKINRLLRSVILESVAPALSGKWIT